MADTRVRLRLLEQGPKAAISTGPVRSSLPFRRNSRGILSLAMTHRTYELEADPPPPMTWKDYSIIAAKELADALSSHADDESYMHALLERHPCLLPGRYGQPVTAANAPFPAAVISKPPLPTFGGPIPDFLWLASDSVTLSPVLIEIEAPNKRWFTKSGQQTSALTQALNQLLEWRLWLEDPTRRQLFINFYKLDDMLSHRVFRPQFLLIYGRRAESRGTEQLAQKRGAMQHSDQQIIVTYDRLQPTEDAGEYMCVRRDTTGYRAVAAPPTMRLGPVWARERAFISHKTDAVRNNPYLTPERRQFLETRLPYWDAWVKSDALGPCSLADAE
jgi:hypothetical protein